MRAPFVTEQMFQRLSSYVKELLGMHLLCGSCNANLQRFSAVWHDIHIDGIHCETP